MSLERNHCKKCLEIGEYIYYSYKKEDIGASFYFDADFHIGSFGEVKQRALDCPTCAQLQSAIEASDGRHQVGDDWCLPLKVERDFSTYISPGNGYSGLRLRLYPTTEACEDMPPGYLDLCRQVRPSTVEIGLLRNWIKRCDEKHGTLCCRSAGPDDPTSDVRPALIIDVARACVCETPPDCSYAALSYVWGKTPTARTLQANLSALCTEGSLHEQETQVPNTIKDAMRLVALLGERYLWVDAFCIVQDGDSSQKQAELDNMGAIYRNATFTVVAAEGDSADYGIPGIPGGSRPRSPSNSNNIISFAPGRPILVTREDHIGTAVGTAWEQRAWTLQEAIFSRRVLLFNKTVRWSCRGISVTENIKSPGEHSPHFADSQWGWTPLSRGIEYYRFSSWGFSASLSQPTFELPTWPDFNTYCRVVEDYTRRQLTFDNDAFNAFAGFLSHFTRYFHGGFHFGLPELMFDQALLWQPLAPLERRQTEGAVQLPSWSWIGWKGALDMGPCLEAYDWIHYLHSDQQQTMFAMLRGHMEVSSIASSTYDDPDCSGGVGKIEKCYEKWREPWLGQSVDTEGVEPVLPGSWTVQERQGSRVFRHPESLRFGTYGHHFPLPMTNGMAARSSRNRSHVLNFETRTYTLYIADLVTGQGRGNLACETHLRTADGTWAGVMRHNAYQESYESTLKGQACRCIAISGGRHFSQASNVSQDLWVQPQRVDLPNKPKGLQDEEVNCYEFYNVLWVEEIGGLSYRKALGRVPREVWDAFADPTPISVALG